MGSAVHGRIPRLVEVLLGIEHAAWLLGRRPRIEVDQRAAVDLLLERREVPADALRLGVIQKMCVRGPERGRDADEGHGGGS
jgi:hypothetical protein